jgi:hypothetical protein
MSQAASIQAHLGDAAFFEVKVLIDHERRIFLDDNGVTLQHLLLALGRGLKDGVCEERLDGKSQASTDQERQFHNRPCR